MVVADDALFKSILDQNPVPTFIIECETLKITYHNTAAARMLGKDVSTLPSDFFLRPADIHKAVKAFQESEKETTYFRAGEQIYRVTIHHTNESIKAVIQVDHLNLVADSRALYDQLPLIVSQRTKIDSFHNEAFFKFTGQNKDDATRVSYLNAVHEDDRAEFRKVIYQHDDQLQDRNLNLQASHSHRLRTANGEYRWVKTEALASAGMRTYLTFDIHEIYLKASRLANQEMLLRLEQQENRRLLDQESVAKEGNRLKGEFLANTSHEIRTPIAGVIGMVDLLLDTELDSEQKDYAESIKSSANALLTVINDVLDFSKIEAGKMQIETSPFELTQVTKDIEMMVSFMAAKKALSFEIDMDPTAVLLMGDRGRIRQILLNLLSNAIKFTQEGSVKLSVIKEDEDDISMKVKFIVTDTGSGMSDETLKNLFKPFAQGDAGRTYGGTGLGLSICKKLIELLHGDIGTESVQGKGTTFWFWLRFERAREDQIKAMEGTNTSASSRRPRNTAIWASSSSTDQDRASPAPSLPGTPFVNDSGSEITRDNLEAVTKAREAEHYPKSTRVAQSPQVRRPSSFERTTSASSIQTVKPPHVANFDDEFDESFTQDEIQEDSVLDDDDVNSLKSSTSGSVSSTSFSNDGARGPDTISSPVFAFSRMPHHKSEGSSESMVSSSTQAFKDKKILLAEDNDINCKIATSMLRKLGYDCTVVKNGQEAVDAVDEQSSFDLILMDVQMPVLNGFEATALIRKSQNVNMRSIPVIALTASAISGDREKCLAAGMDDYLTKPVDKRQLEKKLLKWLEI